MEEAEVHAHEAAYDDAWRAADVERLVACFAEDAVIVNPRGETARGHAEIRRELAAVLSGLARNTKHTSAISRVAFVASDVAVVDGEALIETLANDGAAAVVTHRFTDILVKRDGAWRIAHVRACPST